MKEKRGYKKYPLFLCFKRRRFHSPLDLGDMADLILEMAL